MTKIIIKKVTPGRYFLIPLFFAASDDAFSALVENLTIGNPKATALANSVTADPPGIDSIHYNPAGLTRLKGRMYEFKVIAGMFDVATKFGAHSKSWDDCLSGVTCVGDFTAAAHHDEAEFSKSETTTPLIVAPGVGAVEMPGGVVAPLGGVSYTPPGSKLTFATNVYVPIGGGYVRDDDDPGRFYGKEISFTQLSFFTPSVAYKTDSGWSFGGTVAFSWAGAKVSSDARLPHLFSAFLGSVQKQLGCPESGGGDGVLCGGFIGAYSPLISAEAELQDPLIMSLNLGVLWEPTPWFSWGATYHPESKAELSGDFVFDYSEAWTNTIGRIHSDPRGGALLDALGWPIGANIEKRKGSVDIPLPYYFSTGVSVLVTPSFKINADYKISGWSAWENFTFKFPQGNMDLLRLLPSLDPAHATDTELILPRDYKDVWNWSVGIEHQYSDQLALRAGYEPRPSSIPTKAQDLLVPVGDGHIYSIGASWKLPGTSGFSYADDLTMDIALAYLDTYAKVPAGASNNANTEDPSRLTYIPYRGTAFTNKVTATLLEVSIQQRF